MRGFAVLAVVAFHAWPRMASGGYVGVDVFFILSGYLISSIIFKGLEKNAFEFKTFYVRRIRRIFPALTVVLLACFIFGWFTLPSVPYSELAQQTAAGAGFVSNIVLFQQTGYFDTSSATKPLLHLWSLGIEEQFYLVWPLLLYTAWRLRVSLPKVAAFIAVASFALNLYVARINPSADFYLPFTRFWELAFGSLLAYVTLNPLREGNSAVLRMLPRFEQKLYLEIRSIVGFVLVATAVFLLTSSMVFPGWWALLPTFGTCLLISAGPTAWLNKRILSNPLIVWFGLISYPLYLWHWPLLSFAEIVAFGPVRIQIRALLVLLSILLAWLTYKFVETPLRHGGQSRYKVIGLCTSMATIAVVAMGAWGLRGLPARAINRAPKWAFLAYYDNLHVHGLYATYRAECDFYDWDTKTRKQHIAESCTDVPVGQSAFLWGDSHAQALSYGLRKFFTGNPRVAQVASSGCSPSIDGGETDAPALDCGVSNRYALKEIARLRPRIVIMAQVHNHQATDWNRIADRLHSLGVGNVVLVGPAPEWYPSLPLVFVRHFWGADPEYIKDGLDGDVLFTDQQLQQRYGSSSKIIYVSLIQKLCTKEGCLAHVPESRELMALDYGHLTPEASVFVGRSIIGTALTRDGILVR